MKKRQVNGRMLPFRDDIEPRKKLDVAPDPPPTDERTFKSVTQALQFYFESTVHSPKAIDYEKRKNDSGGHGFPRAENRDLDTHATIGIYIDKLPAIQRAVLALYYGAGMSDANVAKYLVKREDLRDGKHITEYATRGIRLSGLAQAKAALTMAGVVRPR